MKCKFFSGTRHEDVMGSGGKPPFFTIFPTLMIVKRTPVSFEQEAEWARVPVWSLRRRTSFVRFRESKIQNPRINKKKV